jgi:hypothetical protein
MPETLPTEKDQDIKLTSDNHAGLTDSEIAINDYKFNSQIKKQDTVIPAYIPKNFFEQIAFYAGYFFANINNVWTKLAKYSDTGYTVSVQALTSSPGDGATVYFGNMPKAPTTTNAISKVYIRKAGTIKIAEIYCYSGTAGTNENWSLYIRLNDTTDTLIATVGAAAKERVFSNTNLSISVVAGDYIEIKGVHPTWATNPLTTIYGGYLYIENA